MKLSDVIKMLSHFPKPMVTQLEMQLMEAVDDALVTELANQFGIWPWKAGKRIQKRELINILKGGIE